MFDRDALFAPGGYARAYARHVALRLVGRTGFTPTDVPDLEGTILLRVVEGLRDFDPADGEVGGLVTTIVRRAAVDVLRQRRSQKQTTERALEPFVEAVDARPEGEDLRLDMDDVFASLPAPLREYAVGLCSGVSKTELASEHGTSLSSVHRRIDRIRELLTEAGMEIYRPPTRNRKNP